MLLTLFTNYIFIASCSHRVVSKVEKTSQASRDGEQKIDKSKDGAAQMPPHLHSDGILKVQQLSSNFKYAQVGLSPKQNWQSNPVLQIYCPIAYLKGADSSSRHSWMLWSLPPGCYCCETLGYDARKVPTQLIS